MARIEKSLDSAASDQRTISEQALAAGERALLLELANRLAEPQLALDARLDLVEQMRRVLNQEPLRQIEYLADEARAAAWAIPASAAQAQ